MKYWDASALVPLQVQEAPSPTVRRLLEQDDAVATWWGTPVECASALARRRRRGELTWEQHDRALEALMMMWGGWRLVAPSSDIQADALRMVRSHPLGTGDSLQLAAARAWAMGSPVGFAFVTLDLRLRAAAFAERFTVLPE